jgi:hypothetical protein
VPTNPRPQIHRIESLVKVLNLLGIPLKKGQGRHPRELTGLSGYAVTLGGRGGFTGGRGEPKRNLQQMLAHLARNGQKPVAIQHFVDTPYDEAIVSMYVRDWAPAMVALIETDPARYHISTRKDQA